MSLRPEPDAATRGRRRPTSVALALRFVGRNPQVEPQGAERSAGVVNDLRGSDPSQWRTQIPQYRDVVYRDLWPGIDLRLREQSGVLKYEFHVQPGASPSDIRLAYGGADGLARQRRRSAADLDRRSASCRTRRRSSYQEIDGVARAGPEPLRARHRCRRARSRSPSAATSATTSWSSTRACSTRRSSAATPRERRRHRRRRRPATSSSPARRSRPTSRPRPARSTAPARPRTSPTCSSPS